MASAPQQTPPRDDPPVAVSTATTMTGTLAPTTVEKRVSFHSARVPSEEEQPPAFVRDGAPTDPDQSAFTHLKFRRSKTTPLIRQAGESGRNGFHFRHFFRITFKSSNPVSRAVNVLWPLVPAAIAVRYAMPTESLIIFIISYLAMVPCANMIGFAAQEMARKAPHVFGVLTETTLGSLVEIILFMVLLTRKEEETVDYLQVIQAAILGSVLATMLLCLGLCFIAGGLRREESSFSEAVSEAGSGLLLTAGFGLAIPTVFEHSLKGVVAAGDLQQKTVDISRSTAILLIIAYLIFIWFQARTHHGIYDAVFEEDDNLNRHNENDRLTFTECVLALAISITLVSVIAIALVDQIPEMVHSHNISDAFMGLILIPLVEKAAEHLSAIDEAYDNQMNFALSHVLGATLQTALFNGPLAVIVGWGLKKDMSLSFEIFDLAVLILAIITVGNFLRDQKSNYLEGSLCVIVYVAIAVAAFYYPNPVVENGRVVDPSANETVSSGGH
ncbi:hypothetical protein GQ53DRAFT_748024 [Thozetella sp. PMI_491]|nr:hypothetical protein GQ53DRAFT_748024 [Thozetella sp. PMI_491]